MNKKEWNPNEWQGKRQSQVEYANGIGGIFTALLVVTLIIICLFLEN